MWTHGFSTNPWGVLHGLIPVQPHRCFSIVSPRSVDQSLWNTLKCRLLVGWTSISTIASCLGVNRRARSQGFFGPWRTAPTQPQAASPGALAVPWEQRSVGWLKPNICRLHPNYAQTLETPQSLLVPLVFWCWNPQFWIVLMVKTV